MVVTLAIFLPVVGKNILLQHHRFAHFLFLTNNNLGAQKEQKNVIQISSTGTESVGYNYFTNNEQYKQQDLIKIKKKRDMPTIDHDGK